MEASLFNLEYAPPNSVKCVHALPLHRAKDIACLHACMHASIKCTAVSGASQCVRLSPAPCLPPQLVPLLLGSRTYAARLQLYRQLAEQMHAGTTTQADSTCCFVAVGGGIVTDPAQLPSAVATAGSAAIGLVGHAPPLSGVNGTLTDAEWAAERLFDFDHVYNPALSTHSDAVLAVLYGSPGLHCFAPLHRALVALTADSSAERVLYVWRPLLLPACEVSMLRT